MPGEMMSEPPSWLSAPTLPQKNEQMTWKRSSEKNTASDVGNPLPHPQPGSLRPRPKGSRKEGQWGKQEASPPPPRGSSLLPRPTPTPAPHTRPGSLQGPRGLTLTQIETPAASLLQREGPPQLVRRAAYAQLQPLVAGREPAEPVECRPALHDRRLGLL